MRRIVVDTLQDRVAEDGLTSLREALVMAGGRAAEIAFDPALRIAPGLGPVLRLDSVLTIGPRANVTIDGRIGLTETIRIDGGYSGNAFGADRQWLDVKAGARVVLTGLEFVNAFARGANGQDATPGTNGLKGNDGMGSGAPGSNGNSGTGALNNATDAPHAVAVAGIVNAGTLTLDDVRLATINAFGGRGGNGGAGGTGGDGGKGQDASFGPGGFGGNGGIGGPGSPGRKGGDVAGGIYNTGTLTLRDVTFDSVNVYGGPGGG
ncbi:MAG: hypothetical protein ACK4OP_08970, partial [Gemmobacter sp.]